MSKKIPRRLIEYNKTTDEIQEESILVVDVKETLSQLVRRRSAELNLTKAEIARRTGLSRSYIGNIMNETAPTKSGQYNLSPNAVDKLAKVLEIQQTEILESLDYLSNHVDRTYIDVSPDVRVSVLKTDLSSEDADEIRSAFQVAYQVALQRIEEQKKTRVVNDEPPTDET
jgi:transcriptional regulator with XRE-family HTH domain